MAAVAARVSRRDTLALAGRAIILFNRCLCSRQSRWEARHLLALHPHRARNVLPASFTFGPRKRRTALSVSRAAQALRKRAQPNKGKRPERTLKWRGASTCRQAGALRMMRRFTLRVESGEKIKAERDVRARRCRHGHGRRARGDTAEHGGISCVQRRSQDPRD